MSDVTYILSQIEAGDSNAAEKLLPLIYEELRKLAASKMANERKDHTLQGTALVHEAYLRLVNPKQPQQFDHRGHFFAAAAESMRRILVENARRKNRLKRGGDLQRRELDDVPLVIEQVHEDLEALDEALNQLKVEDPQAAELVNLRYFAGLSNADAAEMLRISPRTADRVWSYARAWLHQQIGSSGGIS